MGTQATIINDALAYMATYATTMRIAWPNQDFNPGNDDTWLEVSVFPNAPREIVWGVGPQYLRGFIQVSVFSRPTISIVDLFTEADNVIAHFVKGTVFGGVMVSETPHASAPVIDGDVIFIAVTIPYIGVA